MTKGKDISFHHCAAKIVGQMKGQSCAAAKQTYMIFDGGETTWREPM